MVFGFFDTLSLDVDFLYLLQQQVESLSDIADAEDCFCTYMEKFTQLQTQFVNFTLQVVMHRS
jgi:hypothetical protein